MNVVAFLVEAFPIFLAGLGCGLFAAAVIWWADRAERRRWRNRARRLPYIIQD